MIDIENIPAPAAGQKRLVIVGGGFAGLKLAMRLSDGWFFRSSYQIVLIDRQNFHQFQPLFYQVAMAGLEPSAISFPFRKIFQSKKNVHFRIAEVKEVAAAENMLLTSIGKIQYDYLCLATGADTNFFGNQNIIKNSLPMKSTGEAIFIRNTILHNFEAALNMKDKGDISEFLSVAIVGGGATGVELAGAIAEMKRYVLPKDYPELDFKLMKIYLIESGAELLGAMRKKSQEAALYFLQNKANVEVLLNTKVLDYDGDYVFIDKGEKLRVNTVIWAAGIKANQLAGFLADTYGRAGRMLCNEFNQIKSSNNIFALGDLALQTHEKKYPNGHPQVAPVAMQQGSHLADNLLGLNKGKKLIPFVYKDKGAMATIGRNMAVVDMTSFSFKGIIAWFAWLFVHLLYIIGAKNRFFILLSWAWSYFTFDQSLRLLMKPKEKQKDGKLEIKSTQIADEPNSKTD
jgi:NADH:ubiquinone reductase (H+-translocating)